MNKTTNRKTSTKSHALEAFVTDALNAREALTVAELAELLGGKAAHHRKLAGEVLDRMEASEVVWSNDAGQYRLTEPITAPDLAEVPVCGYRPSQMPHGYEDMHENQAETVTPRKLIEQFAQWVEKCDRKGATLFLAKAIAIGPDGRPV